MTDQAEQIRRRLEARAKGEPLPPAPAIDAAPDFQPQPRIVSPAQPAASLDIPAPPPPRNIKGDRLHSSAIAQSVVVVDVKIKFWSLVTLMVKVAFASIPAALIVALFWMAIAAALKAVFVH